jgi:N-acetylmuramic acid 6-phosphate etherase
MPTMAKNPEHLDNLLTEQANPASAGIDGRSTTEILRIINEQDALVAGSVAAEIPQIARAVEAVVGAIRAGGRVLYSGAGTSGRLGVLDAAECPPTFGVSPELFQGIIAGGEAALVGATEASEDDPAAGERDLASHGFRKGDVLVGIAASGRTPYVLGAIAAAHVLGAVTVGISCTPDSQLARAVDIAITPVPGAEIIAGSTRLRAGTATKLVLNMLSTAAMIRLGYVYGNRMVNVRPSNAKLRDRAIRIIAEAGNVEQSRAARVLDEAAGSVAVAIVMVRLDVERPRAEQLLEAAGGRISVALGEQ